MLEAVAVCVPERPIVIHVETALLLTIDHFDCLSIAPLYTHVAENAARYDAEIGELIPQS